MIGFSGTNSDIEGWIAPLRLRDTDRVSNRRLAKIDIACGSRVDLLVAMNIVSSVAGKLFFISSMLSIVWIVY